MLSLLRRCEVENFNHDLLKNRRLDEFKPKESTTPIQKPAYHDEHEDEEEDNSFFSRFKALTPIIIIAIVCYAGYAWYVDKVKNAHNSDELPVIKAVTNPLREKPEDPGGMKIVNRDKMVYDTISGKDSEKNPKATNVLPEPEAPLSHEDISKKSSQSAEFINKLPEESSAVEKDNSTEEKTPVTQSEVEEVAVAETPVAPAQEKVESKTEPEQPVKTTIVPTTAPTPQTVEKDAKPATPAPKAQVNETSAKPKPATKVKEVTAADIKDITPVKKSPSPTKISKTEIGYRIQLGSYRSAGDAEASGKIIKKKFPDILNGLNEYIEKVDLGDKGIYHRLQLHGFKNEADARKACQKLTEKKQGCFFVGK